MKIAIYIGILGGLLNILGCNNSEDKIDTTTASGKDTTININDILFTVPTIENTFPGFDDTNDSTNMSIPEDDWRQIEFISRDYNTSIEAEIDSINNVFEHKAHKGQGYMGFKDVHVRKLIKEPLSIPLNQVFSYLGNSGNKIAGLNIVNNPGQVKNGFSLISNGVEYYGLKDSKDNVVSLCIYGAESDIDLQNSLGQISKFLKSKNLFLVHWTHTKVFNENNLQELIADFERK